MENYNDNRTPLDRINDSFLAELLEYDDNTHGRRERNDRCSKENCGYFRVSSKPVSDRHDKDDSCLCNEPHSHEDIDLYSFIVPKLKGSPLAMVYSPYQEFEDIYDCEVALTRGTLFKALDLPFFGTACNRSKQCKQCR